MPLERGRLLRQEIDKNAADDVIEIRKVYDDGESGEVVYKKSFTPNSGSPDLTVVRIDIMSNVWVKI